MLGDYVVADSLYREQLSSHPRTTPLSCAHLALIQLSQSDTTEAKSVLANCPSAHPTNPNLSTAAALVDIYAGNYRGAVGRLEQLLAMDPPALANAYTGLVTTTALGYSLLKMGEESRAEQMLQRSVELDQEWIDGNVSFLEHILYDFARVNAIRGNTEEALEWLRRAIERGWVFAYTYMGQADPMLENLREDVAFQELMYDARRDLDRQRDRIQTMNNQEPTQLIRQLLEEAHAELRQLRGDGGGR
jgi:tetratricopeptide (TPR) repeat protein